MVWTYDADISGDRKDEVRWLVGDTTAADPLVQDEEIEYVLTQYPPVAGRPAWLAGAHVADAIAARFARKADRSIGTLSISAKQQRDHYRELAADLRALWATNGQGNATAFAGVVVAAPVLSGGGRTYLGDTTYMNPEGR